MKLATITMLVLLAGCGKANPSIAEHHMRKLFNANFSVTYLDFGLNGQPPSMKYVVSAYFNHDFLFNGVGSTEEEAWKDCFKDSVRVLGRVADADSGSIPVTHPQP